MGGRNSRFGKKSYIGEPSRHGWTRIQDAEYSDSDNSDGSDDLIADRRVLEEVSNWPRSCPVLHLDIENDFQLESQKKLVRSVYRFWIFTFWTGVLYFIAVMATLLTSNVTNSSAMVLAFLLTIVYLFAAFFLYFRALYWALRLESTILYIWFYLFSVAMWAYFVYFIGTALGLVSILAQPLAPGSQLPVKINPIFPVVLFTLVILFYVLSCVFVFYYFSTAFYWQNLSDKGKLEVYKKEQKKKWLSSWWGGKNKGQTGIDDFEDEDGKPKYVYECILYYDKTDILNDPKKKKKKKHASDGTQTLAIPGTLGVYPKERKISFRSSEPIFNSLFKLRVMLINVHSINKGNKTEIQVVEKIYEDILDEDKDGFKFQAASCTTPAMTVRVLRMDFDNKQILSDVFKNLTSAWKAVKKNEKEFQILDERGLKDYRIRKITKSRERAEQHLLTHKHWKLLCSYVWRKNYKAGEVIMEPGARFHDILHISAGSVAVYLETSNLTIEGDDKRGGGDDFDLASVLFPILQAEQRFEKHAPPLDDKSSKNFRATFPFYYTVKFERRSLGFSYRRKKRRYNLSNFEKDDHKHGELFPSRSSSDLAAIVHYVKPKSQAAKLGIKADDELVKVGLYNVENSELEQKAITNLIRNHTYPLVMEFRRPPSREFDLDEAGFIAPETALGIISHDLISDEHADILQDDSDEESLRNDENAPLVGSPAPRRFQEINAVNQPSRVDSCNQLGYLTSDEREDSDEYEEEDLLQDYPDFKVPPKSFEMARLDYAERYASGRPMSEDDDDVHVDFNPATKRYKRVSDLDPDVIHDMGRDAPSLQQQRTSLAAKVSPETGSTGTSSSKSFLERGKLFLFGHQLSYNKVDQQRFRNDVIGKQDDDISIVVEDDSSSVDGGGGYSSSTDEEDLDDFIAGVSTYEAVGKFEVGDTIGIIPWILNQPVSVVQMIASTDVTISSVLVDDLTRLFRKDGTLALAFFKYAAAVIGERADRDEEHLCDQIRRDLEIRDKSNLNRNEVMTRLLDSRPIASSARTTFRKNIQEMEKINEWFHKDFDMEYDRLILQEDCSAFLSGGLERVNIGGNWYGPDRLGTNAFDTPREGFLILTTYHICFRSTKRAMDLRLFKRRPMFYGKMHLNDIYDVSRGGVNGEQLIVSSDECRLTVEFISPASAQLFEDWIWCMINSGTVVERAPSSYTLPGDLDAAIVPDNTDGSTTVFTQQRGYRAEFLILTKTLQQILSKQDKFRLFHHGQSVTLKRGQNVMNAATVLGDQKESAADPFAHRRTSASRKNASSDDSPIGLYMLGQGELVVQRQVNGRRVQFACYQEGAVFGLERFLTGAPSPFTIKVTSKVAILKFVPRERCMALLRNDLGLAARFYQYSALVFMQRLRGAILSRPYDDSDVETVAKVGRGDKGCVIL